MEHASEALRRLLDSESELYSARTRPILLSVPGSINSDAASRRHCPWLVRKPLHVDIVTFCVALFSFALLVSPPVQLVIQKMFKQKVHVRAPTGNYTLSGYLINVVIYAAMLTLSWVSIRIIAWKMTKSCAQHSPVQVTDDKRSDAQ